MNREAMIESRQEFEALMHAAEAHASDPGNILLRWQLAMTALCFSAVYSGGKYDHAIRQAQDTINRLAINQEDPDSNS